MPDPRENCVSFAAVVSIASTSLIFAARASVAVFAACLALTVVQVLVEVSAAVRASVVEQAWAVASA
jgi:hypothetical protein